MDNNGSYSIAEAAEALNLSAKTIRRYIKAGKLPSVKVPTKFGDEYRITEIPDSLREEAEAQARAQTKDRPSENSRPGVEIVHTAEAPEFKLDAHQLYQDNIRLALQLGAANARVRDLEEKLRLLQAPSPSFAASTAAEAAFPQSSDSQAAAPSAQDTAPVAPAEPLATANSLSTAQPQQVASAADLPHSAAVGAANPPETVSPVPQSRPWWKRLFGIR